MKATVKYAGEGLFVGFSPGGHAQAIETDSKRGSAATPVEMLLTALGACTAADVASILEKQRARIASYHVEVSGDRREEYPKKFEKMRVHHVIRGSNLTAAGVARAVELSDTKYCSVAASLRPGVEITSSYEIIEEKGASENI